MEWIDAAGGGGWKPLDDVLEEAVVDPCRSVGYLLRDDDDAIVLAQSRTERERDPQMFNDWLVIPRENVERVTELGSGE